jgi:hypothetical protein
MLRGSVHENLFRGRVSPHEDLRELVCSHASMSVTSLFKDQRLPVRFLHAARTLLTRYPHDMIPKQGRV